MEDEERTSNIIQYYLETSNVQIVDEMVRLITAQRAYEINSKLYKQQMKCWEWQII